TPAAQEIALRITRSESSSVDVHLIERAGQVHVAVRTPDLGLQNSLRQDLGTLVNSLERAGYRTDAALPHGGLTAQSPPQTASNAGSQDKRESDGGWSGSGQPGRDFSGQRRQDQNQPESKEWRAAMEETK
ncbi:MAG TPA: hypothetical protein VKV74_15945, partial [Bryobacteraceae bacterium]|nr:hypothetical protein [Bryobacteraceae bacterium]